LPKVAAAAAVIVAAVAAVAVMLVRVPAVTAGEADISEAVRSNRGASPRMSPITATTGG